VAGIIVLLYVIKIMLVVMAKKWLKSVYIYQSYCKIKTGMSLFGEHSVHYTGSNV